MSRNVLLLVIAVAAAVNLPAAAQTYPAKPVRVIIPFPAGGGADIFGRLLGRKLQDMLGQTFVIDNRAGASGIIGCELVARAAPDGYTLLLGTTGTHSTNPAVYPKLPYELTRRKVQTYFAPMKFELNRGRSPTIRA